MKDNGFWTLTSTVSSECEAALKATLHEHKKKNVILYYGRTRNYVQSYMLSSITDNLSTIQRQEFEDAAL